VDIARRACLAGRPSQSTWRRSDHWSDNGLRCAIFTARLSVDEYRRPDSKRLVATVRDNARCHARIPPRRVGRIVPPSRATRRHRQTTIPSHRGNSWCRSRSDDVGVSPLHKPGGRLGCGLDTQTGGVDPAFDLSCFTLAMSHTRISGTGQIRYFADVKGA
jgi:hypothetical protein